MSIYLIDDVSLLIGPVECPEIPGMGTPIPGNAVELDHELPAADVGFVWAWVDGSPEQLADRRGVVYHTETGARQEWALPGELPPVYTTSPWPGEFYIWSDGEWQLDAPAQIEALTRQALRERDSLLATAALRIAPLQDAVDLGNATPEEQAALVTWKTYRVSVNRIEDQDGFPTDIDWPALPESKRTL